MLYKQARMHLAGCLLLLATIVSAAAQNADPTHYQQGIQASRNGDYARALQHFESARSAGQESASLTYNLAVTHYKLQQFEQAEVLFTELMTQYSEWKDVARYNLGRIEMRRGNDEQAAEYFRQVHGTAKNEKLVRLSREALARLDVSVAPATGQTARKSFGLLSLSGGVDDNVIAFPDQLQTRSSQGEDSFMELLGYGQYYVEGNQGNGVRLHGFAYSKQYNDLDVLDVNSFSIGITQDSTYNKWRLEYGVGVAYSAVDGDELTTGWQGNVKLGQRSGRHDYTAQYKPVYHNAGSDFVQLDGWQHRLDLRWRYHLEHGRWILRYRLDYNDRDDLSTNGTFLSYSPLRNSLMAEGQWYASRKLTLITGAEYTDTQYDGKNQLTDIDGIFKTQERESEKVELWLQANYRFHPHWRVSGEYRYSDTDDNFQLYEYDRNEAKLTLEYSY